MFHFCLTIWEQFSAFRPHDTAAAWKKKKKTTQHKEVFYLTFLLEKLVAAQHQTELVYKCNAMLSDVEIPKDREILSKELLTCASGYTAELQI